MSKDGYQCTEDCPECGKQCKYLEDHVNIEGISHKCENRHNW